MFQNLTVSHSHFLYIKRNMSLPIISIIHYLEKQELATMTTCCCYKVFFFLVSLIFLILCSTFTVLAAASGRELIGFKPATNDTIPFSYIEATGRGPSKWGQQLDPKWKACGDGKLQSPIDLLDQNVKVLYRQEDQLRRDYKPANATIISRGRDIMVAWKGDAGKISINGTDYNLQHSHWHVPAEHTFNFKKYDLELHIVHVNSLGETAVVVVLYKYGKPDPFLSKLFPYIKSVTKQEKSLGIFCPNKMVFESRKLYRYIGSLSVPPCNESVIWTVVKKVRTVSRKQVQLLRDVVDDGYQANARPVQPLNGRAVNLFIRSKNL